MEDNVLHPTYFFTLQYYPRPPRGLALDLIDPPLLLGDEKLREEDPVLGLLNVLRLEDEDRFRSDPEFGL